MNDLSSNLNPILPRIISFITYEEVFNEPITYDELIKIIQSLPLEHWISVASLGRIITEQHEGDAQYQAILFKNLWAENYKQFKVSQSIDPNIHFVNGR